MDELATCVRYVNSKNCAIADRFLGFVGKVGHKAAKMFYATIDTLPEFTLDIGNCQKQYYDAASNMSSIYNG